MNAIYSFIKTDDKIQIAKPFDITEANDILYGMQYYKQGEFLINIGNSLMKHHLLNIPSMIKIGICLSDQSIAKYNESDKESTLKSVVSILENLKTLKNGVHYTIFNHQQMLHADNTFKSLRSPIHIWRFDQSWTGESNYIVVLNPRGKDWLVPADLSFAYQQAEELGLDVVEYQYGMTVEEQLKIFRECKCLVTDNAGQVMMAAMLNTPVLMCVNHPEFVVPINKTQVLSSIKNDEREIGSFMFETDTLGLNSDTLHYEEDTVLAKRWDRGVMTTQRCDKDGILESIIKTQNMKNIQVDYVKKNLDIFKEPYRLIAQRIEDICEM